MVMKEGQRHAQTMTRAHWVIQRQRQRPELTYAERVAEIRRQFKCGKTAAEQVLKVAREILADRYDARNPGLFGDVADFYWDAAVEAKARGDLRAAVRSMDSFRKHVGIGAPERVEHSGGIALDFDKLTDAELELMAKAAGRQVEVEAGPVGEVGAAPGAGGSEGGAATEDDPDEDPEDDGDDVADSGPARGRSRGGRVKARGPGEE